MIERYDIPEIKKIWSEENKFQTYLNVEVALLKALEKNNKIPKDTHKKFSKIKINVPRIHVLDKITGHDVVAFTESVSEQVDSKYSKFFHYGCTSSDIIDTAQSLMIQDSLKLVLKDAEILLSTLKAAANKYKKTITVGRSHGISAEPMSFGTKFLLAYSELKQDVDSIKNWKGSGQASGAVGNYAVLSPQIEKDFCEILNLEVEPVTTQVIGRRKWCDLIQRTSLLTSSIERLAIELRHLQHSDVNEAFEGFSKTQKGSSTMPHKKNPISSENISGLCRLIRSHAQVAHENILLWHERDISHSSNERMYLPDHFTLLSYVLRRINDVVENLSVDTDSIEAKVLNHFQMSSSYVLHFLIDNSTKSREELYKIVQKHSFSAKNYSEFKKGLEKELKVKIPLDWDLKSIKSIYLKNTDELFKRL